MKLMNQITCFASWKNGSGMEGTRAWNNGPNSAPKCAHYTGITNEWATKILLYITHVVQCPPTWVHGKLLESWFGDVQPIGWNLGDYHWRHIFHNRSITSRSTGELRGHWQGWWPLKCPKLYRCILYTGNSKKRDQRSNCRYPRLYSPGTS